MAATLSEWVDSAESRAYTIQFQRIEQLLAGISNVGSISADVRARAMGVTPTEYAYHQAIFQARVRRAKSELDGEVLDRVRTLWRGKTIVCFGDSITADRQSWAEILAGALGPHVNVCNQGRAGDTTADLIARFQFSVAPQKPDAVVVLVGTNDARRFSADVDGASGYGPMAISDEQTRLNLIELDRLISCVSPRAGLWMAPPPGIDERIQQHPSGRLAFSQWRAADLASKSQLVRDLFPAAFDASDAFAPSAEVGQFLLSDGLHPNLAGQVSIARGALALLDQPSFHRNGAVQERKP
ncbi:SGNH/GDSL hydrolase family protein [Demetria terragena]|uniref:SGNH/GDSL hydrolase family protein n=1 Tax=Demetria terragena TaxID=63959 RepID=UPI00036F8654|nr:GDSL-type esterase/lipase family protein [Demetria terragena]